VLAIAAAGGAEPRPEGSMYEHCSTIVPRTPVFAQTVRQSAV